ncbi:MAG TPA: adenylate/guanylate cyclase domain-containing protein [Burkholderiales bacterium]|nr:adenylate/guanylate cyclase domain-containing protein [Burkholderiales bacterium]
MFEDEQVADPHNSALGRLGNRVFSLTDSAELRLHKTLLIFACGLMGFAAVLWLVIYHVMGIKYSATVPLTYLAVSAATLGLYLWNRNFEFFRLAQTTLYLFVPFIMQWAIGSYVTSSGVMLWALLAPIGVMIFQGPKQSIPWFVAYIVLTAVSGFFDFYLGYGEKSMGVPLQTIAVFFALNFTAMSTIVYLLVVYSVREKDRLKTELDEQHRLVKVEQERSERLLLNVLPSHVAERLKREPGVIADGVADCTIMFADLTDFTRLSEEMPPRETVALLNEVFSWFDLLAENYGLEKIKTIGDAYMIAGGLLAHPSKYTEAIADMALEVRERMSIHKMSNGEPLGIHIGIGTGPVVAGVIGVKKFIYDLWGNPVNTASRLCSEAEGGHILVDTATYLRLRGPYQFEGPDTLVVKRQRQITSYRLIAKRHEAAKHSAAV